MALLDELTSGPSAAAPEEGFLAAEARMLAGAKKVALMCLGTAVQKLGEALKDEQEVLGHFADIAMATYALERRRPWTGAAGAASPGGGQAPEARSTTRQ